MHCQQSRRKRLVAPIVLVPIDIVRKSAGRGYAMQMRDEDSQINITLLEFLKQNPNSLWTPGPTFSLIKLP